MKGFVLGVVATLVALVVAATALVVVVGDGAEPGRPLPSPPPSGVRVPPPSDLADDETWLGAAPPTGLTIADLATLCGLLGCQPGDLLGYAPESPADQAALNLANDLFYQSFLAHRAGQEEVD